MAFARGPKIVRDGLVLHLDAANPKSFVSGDTQWNNMVEKTIVGTLTGPTFDGENKGSLVFDGDTDYVTLGNFSSGSTISFNNTSFTIEHVVKPTGYQGTENFGLSNQILSKGPAVTFNYATQVLSADTVTFTKRTDPEGLKHHSFTVPVLTDKISFISFVVNTVFSTVSCYHNGVLIGTTALLGLPITAVENDNTRFGGANTDTWFTGNIYNTRIYNRILTDEEILQNYNALKERFGL